MKNVRTSFLRGLTVQLLAITVLPLTLLLLAIVFGSVSLHEQDMRALVGERDERAVQSAAAALRRRPALLGHPVEFDTPIPDPWHERDGRAS